MSLTLLNLRPKLIDKLGLLSIDEMIPTSSLNMAINAGARRMSSEYPWPWLKAVSTIAVTDGDNDYSLPAGAIKVLTLSIGNQLLQNSALEDMVRYYGVSGPPLVYSVLNGTLTLGPTPTVADTATIVYSKVEPDLVSDSDTLLTPDHYDDIILTYAAIYQATRLKDQSLLATLEMTRKQWLETIARDQLLSKQPRITIEKDAW